MPATKFFISSAFLNIFFDPLTNLTRLSYIQKRTGSAFTSTVYQLQTGSQAISTSTSITMPGIINDVLPDVEDASKANEVMIEKITLSFIDLMHDLSDKADSEPRSSHIAHSEDSDSDTSGEEIFLVEDIRDCMGVVQSSKLFSTMAVLGQTHTDFLTYWRKLEWLFSTWDGEDGQRDWYDESEILKEIVEGIGKAVVFGGVKGAEKEKVFIEGG